MARKERNSVDYFPHPVSHGKKMFYIRSKFGNDGYAVWFMLLEELGKAEFHYLDLKDEIQMMYLSSEFKVSELVLIEIIEILVKFNEFDSDLWISEKILFNQKFVDNVSDAYKKRNNECISKNSLLELLSSKGRNKSNKSIPNEAKSTSKGCDNTQIKEEYIIEDNSIKDNAKNQTTIFDDIAQEFELSEDLKEAFSIWFKYKAEKKQSYKPMGMKTLIKTKLVETSGDAGRLKDMILYSISNNYSGLFERKNNGRTKSTDEGIRAIGNKYFPDEI